MNWREPGAAITLTWFAVGGFLALWALTAGIERLDPRQIGGVSVWSKPLKFQIATVVHLATMAWVASRLGEEWRDGAVLQAVLLLVLLAVLLALLLPAFLGGAAACVSGRRSGWQCLWRTGRCIK